MHSRQAGGERAEARPVRDIAGGEQKGRLLAVQIGQLAFQQNVVMVGPGVCGCRPRPRRSGRARRASPRSRRLLPHAEIIVRAPHGDFARLAAVAIIGRVRKIARVPLEVGENATPALATQSVELPTSMLRSPSSPPCCLSAELRARAHICKESVALGRCEHGSRIGRVALEGRAGEIDELAHGRCRTAGASAHARAASASSIATGSRPGSAARKTSAR